MKNVYLWIVGMVCMTVLIGSLMGCLRNPSEKAQATVLLAANTLEAAVQGALKDADVPLEDMDSFTVTVTKIVLDYAGVQEPEAEASKQEGEAEGEPEGEPEAEGEGEKIVVFEGAAEVNLLDLMEVSQILSSVEIPAGWYTKIRLTIDNPRLVLKSDLDTVLTDIQLTANSRLFVSEHFNLPEGPNLIQLDSGGIHLVATGQDRLVFTPQLRAQVGVSDAAIIATGPLGTIVGDELSMTVPDGSTLTANLSGAAVTLLDGSPGTAADLVSGMEVTMHGEITLNGEVNATLISIVASGPLGR